MDTFTKLEKEQAIVFFTEQIRQFNIMLGGALNDTYRTYLEHKRQYYTIAKQAIIET